MSQADRTGRSGFSFVEFYFGLKLLGGVISLGAAVIFWAEFVRPQDQPRPVWLTAIEYVYGAGISAAVHGAYWALGIPVPDPACTIEVKRFEAGGREEYLKYRELRAVSLTDSRLTASVREAAKAKPDWMLVEDDNHLVWWTDSAKWQAARDNDACRRR